jgi:hypothetical protein
MAESTHNFSASELPLSSVSSHLDLTFVHIWNRYILEAQVFLTMEHYCFHHCHHYDYDLDEVLQIPMAFKRSTCPHPLYNIRMQPVHSLVAHQVKEFKASSQNSAGLSLPIDVG